MKQADIAKLKIGDKVHYQPKHFDGEVWENGMTKEETQFTILLFGESFHDGRRKSNG